MRRLGSPLAATSIEPNANGNAKSVCENRTKVSTRVTGPGSVAVRVGALMNYLLRGEDRGQTRVSVSQQRLAVGEKHF